MKKLNRKNEFERMQKMYENDLGVHKHMNLVTFAHNYYTNQIKKFEELANFWTPEELQKFLKPEAKPKGTPKKKVVIKVKRTN